MINDANRSLKTRIEAEFPVKGSEILLAIPLELRVEVLNCFFVEMSKDRQIWMNKMQANEIEAIKIEISNRKHEELISRFEPLLYVSAFIIVKDFTIHYRIFHKGTLQ